jgi:catechol 2,3-dioxygenase-like lactoylglutathione lyase family enzyme
LKATPGGAVLDDLDFWPTLPAADTERAKRFYAEKLGLSPLVETEAFISYRCGSTMFMLYPTPSAGNAGHTVTELRRRGVVFEEYDLPGLSTVDGIAELGGVERAAWFRDSEGNILAIFEFLTDPTG